MSFLKCKSMDKFFLLTLWLPPRWKTTTMTMTTTTTGRVGEKQIMQLVLRLATSSRHQQQQQADLLESCFWNSLAATTNASSFSRSKAFHPTGATATKTKVQQPRGAANQLVDCKLVCWLLLAAAASCLLAAQEEQQPRLGLWAWSDAYVTGDEDRLTFGHICVELWREDATTATANTTVAAVAASNGNCSSNCWHSETSLTWRMSNAEVDTCCAWLKSLVVVVVGGWKLLFDIFTAHCTALMTMFISTLSTSLSLPATRLPSLSPVPPLALNVAIRHGLKKMATKLILFLKPQLAINDPTQRNINKLM